MKVHRSNATALKLNRDEDGDQEGPVRPDRPRRKLAQESVLSARTRVTGQTGAIRHLEAILDREEDDFVGARRLGCPLGALAGRRLDDGDVWD